MDDDYDEYQETDPVLRVFGSSIVGRVKSGEVGVFASIETQNSILDALAKEKDLEGAQPLKLIFDESKTVRARAHKLERLLSERITEQQGGAKPAATSTQPIVRKEEEERPIAVASKQVTKDALPQPKSEKVAEKEPGDDERLVSRPSSKVIEKHDEEDSVNSRALERQGSQKVLTKVEEPTQKRPQEAVLQASYIDNTEGPPRDFVSLQDPLDYKLSDKLMFLKATVRLRAMPSADAGQVGLITTESIITVDGMTPKWFHVCHPTDAWVLRASPDGEPLFQRSVIVEQTIPKQQAVVQQTAQPTVSLQDFHALVERVLQLEHELESLKNVFRSI